MAEHAPHRDPESVLALGRDPPKSFPVDVSDERA